jgi:hypothetical protein
MEENRRSELLLISDAHKGVVIDKNQKEKTNQTPKKKKRK